MDDGYRWRKYGQKYVKGSGYPRSYYKCTERDCFVKKQVDQHDDKITNTYEGTHNHAPCTSDSPSRKRRRPNISSSSTSSSSSSHHPPPPHRDGTRSSTRYANSSSSSSSAQQVTPFASIGKMEGGWKRQRRHTTVPTLNNHHHRIGGSSEHSVDDEEEEFPTSSPSLSATHVKVEKRHGSDTWNVPPGSSVHDKCAKPGRGGAIKLEATSSCSSVDVDHNWAI